MGSFPDLFAPFNFQITARFIPSHINLGLEMRVQSRRTKFPAGTLKPISTVAELRHLLNPSQARKNSYYRRFCQDKKFIKRSAANLFYRLDRNKDGFLTREDMAGLFDVIIRRSAETHSWYAKLSVDAVVGFQSTNIFNNDILPYSSDRARGMD